FILDASLVDRSKRQVVLTLLGHEMVERARRIVGETEALARAARAAREPLSGTLRMGCIPTVSPFLLPRVLPGLRRAYTNLKLHLVEDLSARLVDALYQGKLDVVLLAHPFECGSVETVMLFDDPFVVGLTAGHPLAKEACVTPQQLTSENLL